MDAMPFLIRPKTWYGWQMIPGYHGDYNVPYFSPIYVEALTPHKSGNSRLTVTFLNALYAAGVRDFSVSLRVLKRSDHYIVGEILAPGFTGSERTAVISRLEPAWLSAHCPSVMSRLNMTDGGPGQGDALGSALSKLFLGRDG